MSHWDPSQTCATIGQFITNVVLKELVAAQLQQRGVGSDPSGDVASAHSLLQSLAPNFAQDILETASGWIPAAAEVNPDSLLPDLDQFPAAPHNVEGLTVQQRKLLLEAIEIILDIFNDPNAERQDQEYLPPYLPRPSFACIAAQVSTVLEHLVLLRPQSAAAACHQTDLDLAAWQRVHAAGREHSQRGSREELVEEVQHCRQRIFELEKELAVQANTAAASAARAKREHTQMATRLLNVNRALELKTKQQTHDAKDLRQEVWALEKKLTQEKWRVEQKVEETQKLEDELSKQLRMQDDMLVREKEYGRRILHLHLNEFESTVRNDHRLKTLSSVMNGRTRPASSSPHQAGPDGEPQFSSDDGRGIWDKAELTADDLADLSQRTLQGLERDLEGIFEERQRRFKEVVKKYETRLQETQRRFQAICEQTRREAMLEGQKANTKGGKFAPKRSTVDQEVQTDPVFRPESPPASFAEGDGLSSEPVGKAHTPRLPPSARPGTDRLKTGRTESRLSAILSARPARSGAEDFGSNTFALNRAGSSVAASASMKRRTTRKQSIESNFGR